MTIDRCEPDLKGHQSDFFIWTICGFNNRCHMGSKPITIFMFVVRQGEMSGLNNSRIWKISLIFYCKKTMPDDIIIQRQRLE